MEHWSVTLEAQHDAIIFLEIIQTLILLVVLWALPEKPN